ncbi:MAG: glycosyltransferase [Solirubrobacteraceae bacterium]
MSGDPETPRPVPDARAVLFVHSSAGHYGADRQLQLIATGLDPARYRPIVVLPQAVGDPAPLAGELRAAGIEVLTRPLAVLRRGLLNPGGLAALLAFTARDGGALAALIRRRDVALVHSNTSVVLGGAAAAALAQVPHVWHVREIYSGFARSWPAYRRLLRTAAVLPCVSRATAAQFPSAPQRVCVTYDGLALDAGRAPRAPARATLGLHPDAPVIAVLGRISDWKGQDVLVRALAQPPLRDRGAIGLIAGEAWPGADQRRASVLELAARLGVSDRLVLVGFREDVETIYGAADLIAVPSTAPDPLPGAAIEAAAAGCAVLASDHGGLPEIIRDTITGRLVAPGDPADLARVACELLADPAQRERLGSAAALDVRERFAPARLLSAVQQLYDTCTARRRVAPAHA